MILYPWHYQTLQPCFNYQAIYFTLSFVYQEGSVYTSYNFVMRTLSGHVIFSNL
jgi:hypothetical protein